MTRTTLGAIAFIAAGVEWLVAEAIVASAWSSPAYSYSRNYISDLGVPGCGVPAQGRILCSPLSGLMNGAFIAEGVLFLVGMIALMPLLLGLPRRLFIGFVALHMVGITIVGLIHGASAGADGSSAPTPHVIGAGLAIVFGNAAIIVVGIAWRRRARWFGILSIAFGIFGLVSLGVLELNTGLPDGVVERASVYTFILWEIIAGIGLLASHRLRPNGR